MKNFKNLIALMLVALLILVAPMSALAENANGSVTVKLSGTGVVSMTPEQAIVRLGVQEQADTVVAAQKAVNKKIASIVKALEESGIGKENISIGYLSIYANYQYETVPYTIIGYNASHQLVIKTTDVAGVGKIVDASLEAGANQLDGIEFAAIDSSASYKKAMELAIADAYNKALAIARSYDKQLGGLVSMTENRNYDVYNVGVAPKAMELDDAQSTEIITGDLSITATIDVVYELLPKE